MALEEFVVFCAPVVFVAFLIILVMSVKVLRPTHRGIVERLGKFNSVVEPGVTLVFPIIDRLIYINTTEQMVDAEQQEIITADNLNAIVDAQVYFKVQTDTESIKKSQYAVNDYQLQIVSLARTTLRDIIGNLTLREANSQRNKLNAQLAKELQSQTGAWGIAVVRTELKEIQPPQDVQETMNRVVKAENEKIAASDFASAVEIQADGKRRAAIQEAQGVKQTKILQAQGEAEAIRSVSEAQNKYFTGNAQLFKKLETAAIALESNSKYIIGTDKDITVVMNDLAGGNVIPINKSKKA